MNEDELLRAYDVRGYGTHVRGRLTAAEWIALETEKVPMVRYDDARRFPYRVRRNEDGCLIWHGRKNPDGYGVVVLPSGRLRTAHRHAWIEANGPIPDGYVLRRTCRGGRRCVRPDHWVLRAAGEHLAALREHAAVWRSHRAQVANRLSTRYPPPARGMSTGTPSTDHGDSPKGRTKKTNHVLSDGEERTLSLQTARGPIAAAAALSLAMAIGVSGRTPTPIEPVPIESFRPVQIAATARPRTPEPPWRDFAAPERSFGTRPAQRQTAGVIDVRPPPERAPPTGSSVEGKASWYCSPAKPICHYAYPPGSMVAAACGKLRRAMGGEADRFWRGKTVVVERIDGKYGPITVTLVDWCGSEDKTIDLYHKPMTDLGGTGVLDVRISW